MYDAIYFKCTVDSAAYPLEIFECLKKNVSNMLTLRFSISDFDNVSWYMLYPETRDVKRKSRAVGVARGSAQWCSVAEKATTVPYITVVNPMYSNLAISVCTC